MLTHEQIWKALDRLAQSNGYSSSGLAKKAGLDPTSFNKSKRHSPDGKPRWPSTESISKVLAVTGATMSDLMDLVDGDSLSLDREQIAAETAKTLIDTRSILFNAHSPFQLKSGRYSPVYFDGRRLISFVQEREKLMNFGAQIIREQVGVKSFDYIAGGETAGIPYGAYISERVKKPMIYVRKEPKGYGRMAQIEGMLPEEPGTRVVLVEDMQTDGGSKKIFVDAMRDAGLSVEHIFVMFNYGIFTEREEQYRKEMKTKLHALCTWWDVIKFAREANYFEEETLAVVEAFLHDPENWEP